MEYQCKNVMFLLIGKKHFHTQSNQSLQSEMLVISSWVQNREFKNTYLTSCAHLVPCIFAAYTSLVFFSMNSFTHGSDEFSEVIQTMRT